MISVSELQEFYSRATYDFIIQQSCTQSLYSDWTSDSLRQHLSSGTVCRL